MKLKSIVTFKVLLSISMDMTSIDEIGQPVEVVSQSIFVNVIKSLTFTHALSRNSFTSSSNSRKE